MIFSCKKFALLGLLERSFSVTAKTENIRVLQSVLLRGVERGLEATAGDGELSLITSSSQATVEETGEMLAPPKLLQIVQACEDDTVRIEATPEEATVRCGAATWQLRLESDEYPEVDRSHENTRAVNRDKLLAALSHVRPAIAGDNLRPMFMFVQFTSAQARATDGHRLHSADADLGLDMLLPSRAAGEVARRARGSLLNTVEIGETDRTYTFSIDDDLLIASKHVLEYPDVVRQMIAPAEQNDLELQVDRKALLSAVQRVALTADPDTLFLLWRLEKDSLTVETLDKMGNSSRETVEAYWPHPARSAGLNYKFVIDMLSAMSAPRVRVVFKDDARRPRPLAFKEEGFFGVMAQLRPDLGDAIKASAARGSTQAPRGWATSTASSPAPMRPGRAQADVAVEDLDSVLETA